MSTFLFLPPEIIDLIVDALAFGDKQLSSVKALSLVCHANLPHCRKRLFATIALYKPPKSYTQTASAFLELLTATPELGFHILSIIYFFRRNETPGDLSMLHVVSTKLARLQSLRLIANYPDRDCVRWNQSTHRHALLPLLHLPTLTHLKLIFIQSFFLSDLIPCIGLKDLHIDMVGFEDEPAGLSIDPLKPISLGRFCIRNQNSASVRTLWRSQRADGASIIDLVNIKTLSIHLRHNQEPREMVEFLGNVQQLTELNLSFTEWSPRLDGLYNILDGSLKTLKHLTFDIFISDQIMAYDSVSALSRELGKAHGRNAIESIQIVINMSTFFAPISERREEWGTLDHALSQGGWPALKYVSLVIMIFYNEELEEALLRLPGTHFTGLMTSSATRFEFEVRQKNY